jgi:hypothetical protein
MSIVYSFTTVSVSVPTSDEFPCLDIPDGGAWLIPFYSGISVSRGAPWVDESLGDLVVTSDDGISTTIVVSLPIGQKFTLETQFKPNSLPQNLSSLNTNRFFIAAFDAQDNAGGILLSRSGLAIVSSHGNTVMPIAGSQNILPESDDPYTMRMVVDGSNNVMDLYITKTSELATVGHQLQYTSAAPVTPSGTPDSIRIELLGHAIRPSQMTIETLRCNCTELVIPNKRPIADTGADQTAALGSVVALDGTASYDPEGEELTYKWFVFATPEGSEFRQDGSDGETVDDGDGDGWTTLFEDGSASSPWSLANSPSLQPDDLLIVEGVQYEVDDTDWTFNSTTGRYDRGGTFDSNELRVRTEAIPDNLSGVPWTVYHQSTFFNDRESPQPTFIPDIDGLYALQLVVNDGQLDSLPDQGLVNIAESNVAFGYIPDVNFIWNYLSDAWDLYDDRDPITTIWSGFAQVASNILLTAWQLDYSKSLVDIPRRFHRRWLDYRPLLEEPSADRDDASIKIFRGLIISGDITGGLTFSPETLLITRDGGDQVTVTLSGTLTAQEIADAVNSALGEGSARIKTASIETISSVEYLVLTYSGLMVIDKDGTANYQFGFSVSADTENKLFGTDGSIGSVTTAFSSGTGDKLIDFTSSGIVKEDLLIFEDVGYEIQKVAGVNQLTILQNLTHNYQPSHASYNSWELSSYVTAANTNFTDELVSNGDILILEIRENGSAEWEEILCEVTGARNKSVGFNPRPLLERVGADISNYEISLMGVRRVNAIPVDSLVQKIPRLQEIILDPPTFFTENRDYSIYENSDEVNGIHFNDVFSFDDPPPDILWAEVTYLDNNPMIENNFGKSVDFKVEHLETRTNDLDYLSAVRGLWYAFFHGPSLWKVRIGIQILLGLPFAETDGTITEINETYNATQMRVLIQDASNTAVTRSYFIPRSANLEEDGISMVEINPATDTEYVVGDTIEQFAPLSKGVEVVDWIEDEEWWKRYHGQGVFLELDKFFKFMARADVDVFDLTNLIFAIDFVKKIRPHYTYPLWVIFKRLPADEISVTDDLKFHGTLYLYDHPACAKQITDQGTGGAYRFDDTDESGNYNWAFDGVPHGGSTKPEFLYDKKRLCPEDVVYGIMSTEFAGGYLPFDWIWAFDDGGGNDIVPLSGPSPSPPPPPYGPAVGTIQFDTVYSAGWYTRGKIL